MHYRVLAPLTLHTGALLGLTADQALARKFGLVPQGVHWCAVKPVSFKAGEVFELEGPLPKVLAHLAEPLAGAEVSPPAPRKPRQPRQPATAQPAELALG